MLPSGFLPKSLHYEKYPERGSVTKTIYFNKTCIFICYKNTLYHEK